MIRTLGAALFATLALAAPAPAQSAWGDLDTLLMQSLTAGADLQRAYWLPDSADPATAREAIGVAYTHIPGSAGSVSISVGYFVQQGGRFALVRPVTGLFGGSPRAPVFAPDHIGLTTTTLLPGEPRCCPTGVTSWIIDRRTLQARARN